MNKNNLTKINALVSQLITQIKQEHEAPDTNLINALGKLLDIQTKLMNLEEKYQEHNLSHDQISTEDERIIQRYIDILQNNKCKK